MNDTTSLAVSGTIIALGNKDLTNVTVHVEGSMVWMTVQEANGYEDRFFEFSVPGPIDVEHFTDMIKQRYPGIHVVNS